MNKYTKTDLSKILLIPNINENNFIDIFDSFNEKFKDYKFNISQNENQPPDEDIFKSESKNKNENIKELQSNSNSKTVEIFDNGSVEIKSINDINTNENEIKLFNFDNEEENKQKKDKQILNIDSNDNINNIRINNSNIIDNNNLNPINNKFIYEKKPIFELNKNPKEYQKTDTTKILKTIENDIFQEKFKQMIDFFFDKLNPNNFNNNYNSSNVRLDLNSSYKKKPNPSIYTIREEDNESFDSLSLHKSIKNSAKATPNLIDLKKKSINDIQDLNINNNLLKSFSKEKTNSNNDINDIFIKEENNLENDKIIINKNINPEKKENKIMVIDLNINSENKNNNINYTTPESKEKTMEKIYENVKDINEERDKNSGPKEFSNFENEDIKFSDFNPSPIEEEKKDDKNIIIINNNINIIGKNNNFEQNKQMKNNKNDNKENLKEKSLVIVVSDKKNKIFLGDINSDNNKKLNIHYVSYLIILQLCSDKKLTLNKLYEKFIKKLLDKLPIVNEKNNISQKKEMNNSNINNDINSIENKIKQLKECYLYLIVNINALNQKNGIKNIETELENNLANLLSVLNTKEKENNNFYVLKIKNILEKFKVIKTQEIFEAMNKLKRNELKQPKYKIEDSNQMNKNEKSRLINRFNFGIILTIIIVIVFSRNFKDEK